MLADRKQLYVLVTVSEKIKDTLNSEHNFTKLKIIVTGDSYALLWDYRWYLFKTLTNEILLSRYDCPHLNALLSPSWKESGQNGHSELQSTIT